jgi:hypothetical protein
LATSTRRLWCRKKSAPKIGKATAARRKVQSLDSPPMETVKDFSPQHGMERPSAPVKLGPEGTRLDCQGMMEKAEPVSTRKRRLEEESVT